MPTAFKFCALLRLVKIEHSVFALPFAYIGLFIAAGGRPGWRAFVLVTLAMVAVRSFAMTVNRLADLNHDRTNPRTQDRPLVTGEISVRQAGTVLRRVRAGLCRGLRRAEHHLPRPVPGGPGPGRRIQLFQTIHLALPLLAGRRAGARAPWAAGWPWTRP